MKNISHNDCFDKLQRSNTSDCQENQLSSPNIKNLKPENGINSSSENNEIYEMNYKKSLLYKKTWPQIKKKRKRKTSSICLESCKYNIIRKIAKTFDMKEVQENDEWNVYWTDCLISTERVKEMRGFQRINHFPGMTEICRKDLLARNLNRMLKYFPKEYNFFPKTWCLPVDFGEALNYSRKKNRTYILKPDIGCRGKGIFLTKSLKDLKPFERMICQIYISKPFLIDGLKFDLRIYTLITSCDPLRIYVYNEGLARFATSRYCEPAPHNSTNMFMHLTNYSVNKYSRTYVVDDEAGTKRRISTINAWLERKEHDVSKIWASIDDIIVKTVIAAYPTLKHSYHTCFPSHEQTSACFELLGFDILLDYKFKPYLLEVNHSPSFHTDADLDKEVKENLIKDTFKILNLSKCDKKRVIEEDKQRVRNRLMQVIQNKGSPPMM
uniref:Tubulin--tyrosine ligase-like protein 9 n=1 Tax=Clastoptera arizonana TaxID=38151 RepID=A0A1B6BYI8_9HEMI